MASPGVFNGLNVFILTRVFAMISVSYMGLIRKSLTGDGIGLLQKNRMALGLHTKTFRLCECRPACTL